MVATGLRLLPAAYQWYRLLMRMGGAGGADDGEGTARSGGRVGDVQLDGAADCGE